LQRIDNDVKLEGITREDIQDIFEKTLKEFKEAKTRIIYLDASYLYTFDLSDSKYITKLCLMNRFNPIHVREWHRLLERWYNDQTVRMYGNGEQIEPIEIDRTFDRIVNEGLEALAAAICGTDSPSFNFRSIGDGVVPNVYPNDSELVNQIDRINVLTTANGGSLSRDGSTVYSIGNHSKTIPSAILTEVGIQSTVDSSTDIMLDHSRFSSPITHVQNADAPGSTTIIYMCSG